MSDQGRPDEPAGGQPGNEGSPEPPPTEAPGAGPEQWNPGPAWVTQPEGSPAAPTGPTGPTGPPPQAAPGQAQWDPGPSWGTPPPGETGGGSGGGGGGGGIGRLLLLVGAGALLVVGVIVLAVGISQGDGGKADAEAELDDAQAQLDDAQAELDDAQAELEDVVGEADAAIEQGSDVVAVAEELCDCDGRRTELVEQWGAAAAAQDADAFDSVGAEINDESDQANDLLAQLREALGLSP